jgi:hypothetical protein
MSEEVFESILNSSDGNYNIQAQILALMKPLVGAEKHQCWIAGLLYDSVKFT